MKAIYLGATPLQFSEKQVSGKYVTLDGEDFYCIGNYDNMPPFFMTLVSPSDHWLFISSNGGLSAGRRNPGNALFPYYTDDKIHDSHELTGSKTILLIEGGDLAYLWEPFSKASEGIYKVTRNLYKNIPGNKLIFEECNHDLGLTFRYGWFFSEKYGFVKRSELVNQSEASVAFRVLDGLQNLLPYGVNQRLQTEQSTLIDAYKKNELDPETGLGMFLLSSIPVDRAEPSEALKATTVWSSGWSSPACLLSIRQLDRFREGFSLQQEVDIRADRGAYFVEGEAELNPGDKRTWFLVAEVSQGPVEVAALRHLLATKKDLGTELEEDIQAVTEGQKGLVAQADGLQLTADKLSCSRHFSNVLFNIMRGGIFDHHYSIDRDDALDFLESFNRPLAHKYREFLHSLPPTLSYSEWLQHLASRYDKELYRLALEYLPLTFSRRHGDPSRPWNYFSIDIRKEDGSKALSYQGNWRDIFQNWEALAFSFPGFIEGMIAKFLNASTIDGYNPYRITREGIDWEVEDPHDPWSYIGYWGDHQIIYLLKLLELSRKHHPETLREWLSQDIFAFANVPYRIKPYTALLKDPQNTITFDEKVQQQTVARTEQVGADGKLLWKANGKVYQVNLAEKLLLTLLAKLSNFIPEAGIWLNTQRPEWNDANNALVGHGVSMVTLYHLRRYLTFCQEFFADAKENALELSSETTSWLEATASVWKTALPLLKESFNDSARKQILDALGTAASAYREEVYKKGFSGDRHAVPLEEIQAFFENSLAFIDHSIRANRRKDGLYHSYNLMKATEGEISVGRLYEMLEGQVALLSSGFLSPSESVDLLHALKGSAMFRKDQYSYLLYPDRKLPRFLDKNNLPSGEVLGSALLSKLIKEGDQRLVQQDVLGNFHFNGKIRNAGDVQSILEELSKSGYRSDVEASGQQVLNLFEAAFDHQSFTGRSGTFYGYEGLGCIYWHMVSKLLLAVQETYFHAVEQKADPVLLGKLVEAYYEVRAGIGLNKTPEVYGAFPTDPYSHTPGNAGAQQPGMTGQVKEDVIARWGELGVQVEGGCIHIRTFLLRKEEFCKVPGKFTYFDLQGDQEQLKVPVKGLAFTYCQTPFLYRLEEKSGIALHMKDGTTRNQESLSLSHEDSQAIFDREGEILWVEVWVNPKLA